MVFPLQWWWKCPHVALRSSFFIPVYVMDQTVYHWALRYLPRCLLMPRYCLAPSKEVSDKAKVKILWRDLSEGKKLFVLVWFFGEVLRFILLMLFINTLYAWTSNIIFCFYIVSFCLFFFTAHIFTLANFVTILLPSPLNILFLLLFLWCWCWLKCGNYRLNLACIHQAFCALRGIMAALKCLQSLNQQLSVWCFFKEIAIGSFFCLLICLYLWRCAVPDQTTLLHIQFNHWNSFICILYSCVRFLLNFNILSKYFFFRERSFNWRQVRDKWSYMEFTCFLVFWHSCPTPTKYRILHKLIALLNIKDYSQSFIFYWRFTGANFWEGA